MLSPIIDDLAGEREDTEFYKLDVDDAENICKEYGIAKPTMRGWICKYASLVANTWKIEGVKNVEEEYVDITAPLVKEYKEQNIINTTNETVRIFKNGYTILCHISKLDKVMRIIKND